MNVLRSQVKKKNSQYLDIDDLAYISPESRGLNKDVLETGVMINPIVVYRIDGVARMGTGGVDYRQGCVGKKYLVHKGNSRVPAALKLGYTHIEGIIDDGNTFTL